MRTYFTSWLLLHSFRALANEYLQFTPAYSEFDLDNGLLNPGFFRRSDSKCGTSCSGLGSPVCCGKKASCALDQAGNVACCPNGAACTGAIAAPSNTITSTGSGNSAAAPTAAPSAAISHAISGTSTIANSFYPFPVLPTDFANAGECSQSYSGCQAESAKCTGFVEGGGYGVTIAGPGGGVTQQGPIAPASAEAICSSLSQQACHGLQLNMCSTLGGAAATSAAAAQQFVVGTNSKAAGPTRCVQNYGIGVGIAIGVARHLI